MARLLIVFCKNPQLGKVKTRLAKTLGDETALAVYLKLVNHTQQVVRDVNADVAIYYSDYIDTEDHWEKKYIKKLQQGTDLGERMYCAVSEGLGMGYQSVCLIGTDIFELTSEIVEQAFQSLEKSDVVIGPARDGGYYLIGMKRADARVFEVSQWSTATVLKETLRNVKQQKLSYSLLKELNDIDDEQDLRGTDLWR